VPIDRITLGGVCSYGPALQIMESKLGKDSVISRSLTVLDTGPDGQRVRAWIKEHNRRVKRKARGPSVEGLAWRAPFLPLSPRQPPV
jgi:hypothetical protein